MNLLTFTESEAVTAFLVFVRTMTLVTSNPLFGHRNISVRIRILFGVVLSVVLIPVVPSSPTLVFGMWEMGMRIIQEIFIGAAIGFLVTILFSVVSLSGQLISYSAGLAMASMFDAAQQSQSTVLVAVKTMVLFLTFLALNFHHVIVRAMAYSFIAVPPGAVHGGARVGFYFARQFSMIFETALLLALPIILVVFLVNLCMAIIARVAPQMNVFFSIGAQTNEQLALLLLGLSFPMVVAVLTRLFGGLEQYFAEVILQFQ